MHPDDLLEQLKANANARKQKNLDLIHAVCREQYERGSKDFSVATISRIAQERGGPATSTIHNKTGDGYKGLIRAWAEHTGGVTRKVRQVSENPYAALIDKESAANKKVKEAQKALDAKVAEIVAALLAGGPNAQAAAKDLIRAVDHQPVNHTLVEETAHRIAHLRATPEAREGISAFLDKRQPNWIGE